MKASYYLKENAYLANYFLTKLNIKKINSKWHIPKLPFEKLKHFLSSDTIFTHYEKHHKGYLDKLNNIITQNPNLVDFDFFQLMFLNKKFQVYNNACQVWNHCFYWKCLTDKFKKIPRILMLHFQANFINDQNFKDIFIQKSQANFGSGWTWYVYDIKKHKFRIINTQNADTPLLKNQIPIFVVDVWEHAYYLDYKNERIKYLEKLWTHVNWSFVSANINMIEQNILKT